MDQFERARPRPFDRSNQRLWSGTDSSSPRRDTTDWNTMLAHFTGSVDRELLLRNEYLVTENRIPRKQLQGRLCLTDSGRRTLAEIVGTIECCSRPANRRAGLKDRFPGGTARRTAQTLLRVPQCEVNVARALAAFDEGIWLRSSFWTGCQAWKPTKSSRGTRLRFLIRDCNHCIQ